MKVIKLTENNNILTENKADEYYRKLAQKLYDEHNYNFNKAIAERDRRSLWGSDW